MGCDWVVLSKQSRNSTVFSFGCLYHKENNDVAIDTFRTEQVTSVHTTSTVFISNQNILTCISCRFCWLVFMLFIVAHCLALSCWRQLSSFVLGAVELQTSKLQMSELQLSESPIIRILINQTNDFLCVSYTITLYYSLFSVC